MLYDRPVADLMVDAAAAMPERFAPADVIAWLPSSTVKTDSSELSVLGDERASTHCPPYERRSRDATSVSAVSLAIYDQCGRALRGEGLPLSGRRMSPISSLPRLGRVQGGESYPVPIDGLV